MYDFNTMLTEFDVKEAARINRTLAPPADYYEPVIYLRARASMSTWARINEALGCPKAVIFYLGLIAGSFATVITAAIWGTML